jgi:hypothetical protein
MAILRDFGDFARDDDSSDSLRDFNLTLMAL